MKGLDTSIDYFLFSKVKDVDERNLHDKAIEAILYYRAVSLTLRSSALRVEIRDKIGYIVTPEGIHIPFMKVKPSREGDGYEVWIATDLSLRYIMSLLSKQ